MTEAHQGDEMAGRHVAGPLESAARDALARARDHLLGLQHEQGWWQAELKTNVTMDAEDLLFREFLGIGEPERTAAVARWVRSSQREDGTWTNYYAGPGDLSTTVEAYVALRLAGDPPEAAHMTRAARWIRSEGGLEATRVFTRMWMAMSGQWPWDGLPVIPPELIYLPAWFPLNIYDWACWARQIIVPLAIVGTFRPSRPLPFTVDELRTGVMPARRPADAWAIVFGGLDAALHCAGRWGLWRSRPGRAVRRAALRRCSEWIIARQERDGGWGGIQPAWVYSLIALHLLGYRLDHPLMARGLAGFDRYTIKEQTPEGPLCRLEASQSPLWDTAFAMTGLADAGLPPDHPALRRAARWLLAEEIPGPGDWQVRKPGLAPGGWAFEFDNDNYPDTDDTAEIILALRRVNMAGQERPSIERATRWLTGMQSRDGGWGAFDADNTRRLVTKLPFCDFGAVTDPPSADVTAHVVETLAAEAAPATSQAAAQWRGFYGHKKATGHGSAGGQRITSTAPALPCPRSSQLGYSRPSTNSPRGRLAGVPPEPGRRVGRGPALLPRSGVRRPGRVHGLADRLGPAGPAGRGREGKRGHRARGALASGHPARGRHLGRALVHRDGVSRRLLHQLPHVPARLSPQRARPLPESGPLRHGIKRSGRSEPGAQP